LAKVIEFAMTEIQGREPEREEFNQILRSEKAELLAVVGRRRIGKTFLIRQHFKNEIVFEFTGIFEEGLPIHMDRFSKAINTYFYSDKKNTKPKNWYAAFDQLEKGISAMKSKKKKVIFLDELPWMASSNLRFKKAFGHFWNSWASKRNDIVVVISGSSTSWMYSEIFEDTGGMYHRVTRRIFMEPFTLRETEAFLKYKKILFNRNAVLELYLILGGIPFYLDLIKQGESVTQAIDRLYFKKNSELKSEFDELFKSLFGDSEIHKTVVTVLSQHLYGLTRMEIMEKLKQQSSGNFSYVLTELEKCGYISAYVPFGKKTKDTKYKLTDAFTLFYLKFVKGQSGVQKWENISKTQVWKSWSGLAFENTCMHHIDQIKIALKIAGMTSVQGAWHHKGNETMFGSQIDLLLDRDDGIINICEIKYYNNKVIITKEMATEIRNKMASFAYFTKSKKTLFPILIAPYGMHQNEHSLGLIQNVLEIDQLFEKK
jgi:uncharacterized protein